jgi:hypothetical protein
MEKQKDKPQGKKTTEIISHQEGQEKLVALKVDFGSIYVRIKGEQILRPIKAEMMLYEKLGHIYKVADKYAITASGYTHLNKVASISIVTPQRVVIDGVAKPNPHIERNSDTKAIETVNIRKIGIGYSPAGNVTVIDKTLFYNVYTYFIQSIQAKMKRKKWDDKSKRLSDEPMYPNCAVTGIAGERPKIEGSWAFFPTAPPLGLWVNYKDPAILDCLEEHTQRQRFGDRIAQKIVERNILKDHPAIGLSNVFPKDGTSGTYAFVTVYGYRHEFEAPNIAEILEQADKRSDTFETTAEVIDQVEEHEEKAAINEVVTEEGEEKPKPFGNPAVDKEPPPEFFEGKKK